MFWRLRRIAGTLMLEAMIVFVLTITCIVVVVKVSTIQLNKAMQMTQSMELQQVAALVDKHGLLGSLVDGYEVQKIDDTSVLVTYKNKNYKATWINDSWNIQSV